MARGYNWESIDLSSIGMGYMYDVLYIPNKGFLASGSHLEKYCIFSTDARNWTPIGTRPPGSGRLYSMGHNPVTGRVIGVGGGGYVRLSSDDDLETWERTQLIYTTPVYVSVAYGNGIWVAVGLYNRVITSLDDGETWNEMVVSYLPATKHIDFRKVIYVEDTGFFIFGTKADWPGTTSVFHSIDGLNWTKITSGEIMSFGASGACKGKDKFISVYGHTSFISKDFEKSAYSYDGFTWHEGNIGTKDIFKVITAGKDDAGQEQFVAFGNEVYRGDVTSHITTNYKIAVSSNGINWDYITGTFSPQISLPIRWWQVIYAKGIYIAVGGASSQGVSQGVMMISGEFDHDESNEPTYGLIGRLMRAVLVEDTIKLKPVKLYKFTSDQQLIPVHLSKIKNN